MLCPPTTLLLCILLIMVVMDIMVGIMVDGQHGVGMEGILDIMVIDTIKYPDDDIVVFYFVS